MPSTGPAADIIDPRQAQAFRELSGQLASTEEHAARVQRAFEHFGTTAEQSARTAGSAIRETAGEPLDLLQDQLDRAMERARAFDSAMDDFVGGAFSDFRSALSDGKIEMQEWADIGLNAISRLWSGMRQLNSSSFGGGGGGFWSSLLGSFGGFFADGGKLGAGRWGIAGEDGPEIVHGPAQITPMTGMASANSSAPAQTIINQTNYITNPFGMEGVERALAASHQSLQAAIPGSAVDAVATVQRRTAVPLG